MSDKLLRWILSLLLVIPLFPMARTLLNFNLILRDITGFIVALIGIAIVVVIPIVGVWREQGWFPYYIYVLAPLEFIGIVGIAWFISLFGDQYYSPLSIGFEAAPLLIYFGTEIVLTVLWQRRRKSDA